MISYYELLGLIKEGKQPSEVKFRGDTYSWNGEYYKSDDYGDYLSAMFEIHMFNKNIEIIEDKPKKIEPFEFDERLCVDGKKIPNTERGTRRIVNENRDKIEKLIKAVNYLLKEDKHE